MLGFAKTAQRQPTFTNTFGEVTLIYNNLIVVGGENAGLKLRDASEAA